jgi:CRP/FNR family transcriptional regulator, anaerobic regulatory protein
MRQMDTRAVQVSQGALADGLRMPEGLIDWVGCAVYERGRRIAERDVASSVLCIVDGCARAVNYSISGRRQISRLYLPGDLVGLVPLPADIEAASPLVVLRGKSIDFLERHYSASRVAALRHRVLAEESAVAQEHLMIVTRGTAQTRLAWLLLRFMRHVGARKDAGFTLAISRLDIADYLALTQETVCRTLSMMRHERIVDEDRRRSRWAIRNVEILRDMANV